MPITEEEAQALADPLLKHAQTPKPEGLGLTGLMSVDIVVDVQLSFHAEKEIFVAWELSGRHGASIAAPGDELAPGDHFLGWAPTARDVRIRIFTVGVPLLDENGAVSGAEALQSRYDQLTALRQLGVLAVGRPVLAGHGH
jgi:hypothetical protein